MKPFCRRSKSGGNDARLGCGLRFSVPMPDDEETAWLYTERYDYAWFARRRGLKKIQAWHRSLRVGALLREAGQRPGGSGGGSF